MQVAGSGKHTRFKRSGNDVPSAFAAFRQAQLFRAHGKLQPRAWTDRAVDAACLQHNGLAKPYRMGTLMKAKIDPLGKAHSADEIGNECGLRLPVKRCRASHLDNLAGSHDRDPIRHGERLLLIVRDIDHRRAKALLKLLDLQLHGLSQLLVERAERLVHEEHRWLEDNGTGNRDALLLAA
ncbi:hypothetical protein GGD56_000684 [Rhizobium mongolense]|uniref:Uncharacterized protein n=2 Tax=Rhizobium mongolense TaxID=57676 RepID=A0ABR6IGY8_9HYPH|nr:hypothetical protein [Rhizobium mongolense]TVZ74083.1 hypothetical protein BCL32_2394 [Rhizobium mongolense USDA 1844]